MGASYPRPPRRGSGPALCAAALVLAAGPLAARQAPATRLPDVEVRAARGLATSALLPAAVTVLDSLPGPGAATRSLADLLRTLPGVLAVDQGNPGVDERLSIRGFGSRSAFGVRGVAVLLDGVPQTLPDGQGQLTDVDPAELTGLEVLRGGASTLHGNAAGGVLAVRTDLMEGPVGGRVTADAGGFGARRLTGDGAVLVGAARLAAGFTLQERDGWREQSASEVRRARLGLALPLGRGVTARGFLRLTDQPLAQNPGGLTAAELEQDPTAAAPANLAADAGKATRQWQGALALAGAAAAHTWRVTAFGSRRDVENPLPFGTIVLDRASAGVRGELTRSLGGGWRPRLVAGLDAQWMDDDRRNLAPDGSTVTLDQRDRVRELGPFALVRVQPAAAWLVSAGLRWHQVVFRVDDRLAGDGDASGRRRFTRLAPALGVTWLASGSLAAWAGIRSSFETPTTTELVNRPDGAGGLSGELEPQRAWHLEAGVRGAGAAHAWEATAWLAEVRDLLVPFEDPAEAGRRFFRNAGRARHLGVELAGRWRAAGALELTGSWAFTRARYLAFRTDSASFDGNRLPGVPPHRATLGAVVTGPGGVSAAVDLTASSGLPVDDANSARSDAWATAAVRLWWRPRGGRVEPYLAVHNLLDTGHVPSVIVNAAGGRFYEPGPGRQLTAGVRWSGG